MLPPHISTVYGDVVAFSYPEDPSRGLVKRVIGLPGDVIEIKDGYVIRNGQILPESYVVSRDRRTISELTVPADSYYVLGDNRRSRRIRATGALFPRAISLGTPGSATGLRTGLSSSIRSGSYCNAMAILNRRSRSRAQCDLCFLSMASKLWWTPQLGQRRGQVKRDSRWKV